MADESKIEWTDASFNPWEGCEKVSPGCKFCYAEARDHRFTGGKHWGGKDSVRRVISTQLGNSPHRWQREQAAKNALADKLGQPRPRRPRVFCASLADVWEDRADLVERRAKLFETIRACPDLDWLVLTKRPENITRLWPKNVPPPGARDWPHLWLGCTGEDQEWLNKRLVHLLMVPAVIHFVSLEPLLGPIDLREAFAIGAAGRSIALRPREHTLDWAIIGGESGFPNQVRPFVTTWAESLIEQCRMLLIKPFVKQLGAFACVPIERWRDPSRFETHMQPDARRERTPPGLIRMFTKHPKGGDMNEWPPELRVREFPSGGFPT